jgi:EAL domain-containing protein (putative c-di-GMP-specific phosphodiesterase class I)
VSLQDRQAHHFEALVRLNDSPTKMNPYNFVCFAEDNGLIAGFDIAICKKLISRIKTFATGSKILPIAMNISGRSIESDAFIDELRSLVKETPSANEHMLFEITETARITDLERANNVCLTSAPLGQIEGIA